MQGGDAATFRAAVLFLDRYRRAIEGGVNHRLGREEPPPEVRLEVVRRFRSFCRLTSFGVSSARPSLDGLGGQSAHALERTVQMATQVALECGPSESVAQALEILSARFRAGVRRIVQPETAPKRKRVRRRLPNAGRRVRSAIDRISDAYIALCLDTGHVHDLNPAAENLLGTTAEKILGRSLVDLVAAPDRTGFLELEARLDAGEEAPPIDVGLLRPDGEGIPVELSVANHTIGGKRLAIFVAREKPPLKPPLLATPSPVQSRPLVRFT
jgi:PAS domain S-box-containing protein